MAKIQPLFKFIAVLNALLLFGAYVCYRGGIVRAFGQKPAAAAVPEDSAGNDSNYTTSSPDNNAAPLLAAANTQTRSEILPGSKSSGFRFEDEQKLEPKVIMSGSKSMSSSPVIWETNSGLTWPSKPATATTTTKPATSPAQQSAVRQQATPQKQIILSGSKSARVDFTEDTSQTEKRQQAAENPKPQRRVMMGGSKSGMPIVIQPAHDDTSERWPTKP